ncbi:MAG: efflux transporter periplasmic adaptor subunit [Azospirillum brasilense]|nr:MAG: efflux transporter periplasmic adaptor subunit [Azospirillum brasilense]
MNARSKRVASATVLLAASALCLPALLPAAGLAQQPGPRPGAAGGTPPLTTLPPRPAAPSVPPPVQTPAQRQGQPTADAAPPALYRMTDAEAERARIRVAAVSRRAMGRQIQVPGTLIASGDRLVRVPTRVSGLVAELRKRPGDVVSAGDLLAIIESREAADAKAEYLAALRADELSSTIYQRERRLWERRVTAEQDLLRARAEAEGTRIRVDLAQQKLVALGLPMDQIRSLPRQPTSGLPYMEVRAPISGRVSERNVDLGGSVTADTQAFVVVDLSLVWVEMAVPATELGFLQEGQTVAVTGPNPDQRADARLIFVSPTLDNQTRSARAVAELPNSDGTWRPGVFVNATVQASRGSAGLAVPREAIQTMANNPVIFVRTADGFERRTVRLGASDDRTTEVVSGLDGSERIAVSNTFLLKAEFLKAEGE